MKSFVLTISLCLVVTIGSLSTGCQKIKAFVAKKTGGTPTPAVSMSATPAAGTGAKGTAAATSGVVAVLCYHRFENGKGELIITPQEFEAQMKRIADAKLNVISMTDFLAWRRGEKSIAAHNVLITLDDGWVSGYTEAWPILKKYNFPFTMFVYTDYIKGGPKSGGKSMTWEQLEEMRNAGIDVECHTTTHSDLRRSKNGKTAEQYAGYLNTELAVSKDVIEQHLAIKVAAVAYPYGNYNKEAEDKVKEVGYEAAFTVNPQKVAHNSPPAVLGRYAIDGRTPQVFDAAINFGSGSSGPAPTEVASMAAASMLTKPAEGEVVHDGMPVIEANLQALGKIDPKSVQMLISGFGMVPAKYDAGTGLVHYQPTTKMSPKMYTVIIQATADGKRVETRWNFSVDAR